MRRLPWIVLLAALGCGPGASPAVKSPAVKPLAPYRVTLAADAKLDDLVGHGAALPAEPHLSGDQYIIRLASDRVADLGALPSVTAIEPLPATARFAAERFTGDRAAVVVDLFAGATDGEKAAVGDLLGQWGATVDASAPDTLRTEVEVARLAELAALPAVRWIEPAER